jgi:hypothetical protein
MDSVRVNVESYDETTHSLVVNFSGMQGSTEYTTPSYAFQVANYNTSDLDTIIKKIAQVGSQYLDQLAAKDTLSNNSDLVNQLKNLESANYNFTPDQLVTPPPAVMPINTGVVDNLEVVL